MKKIIASLMMAFVFVFSFFAVFSNSEVKLSDDTKNSFVSDLVEIYQTYDGDVKTDGEFALRRLILSNYSGSNTYSAVAAAVDKKHDLTVLQYESEEAAQRAYKQIEKDGIAVDADSKATLGSIEKGSVYPSGSNALGTTSFISKFGMEKEDVIVAVIDTGVMYDHELMANRFVSNGYDFSDDGRSNAYYNTLMNDSYYAHGTFVCGIIADNTPDNVKILPYKAVPFGSSEASNSAIVAAIYDAVDKGASVINISMSASSGANALKYAVQNAISKNVCVCASAGNDAKEVKYRYPAATPGVITASAVESDMQTFASFSNYGSAVDFCAPGRKIVSACPYKNSDDKYMTNSGTSFSVPYITAACADIKSINNSFSKDEVYSILCDFSADLGDEGYDIYFGNGMPKLSDMVYTDNESYSCKIPEGYVEIFGNTADFTEQTQPWKLFADRIKSVSIDDGVESIGAYSFNNMKTAEFEMPKHLNSVGAYAFNNCKKIDSYEFDIDVIGIGENAFGNMNDEFYISGYRNTAAEVYCNREGIAFNALGCKHNYFAEVVDPTDEEQGYTIYTCTVCGDSYIGDYIEPPEYYEGDCGMGVKWRYTTKNKTLSISGNGYMNSYSSENEVPWKPFMKKITGVVIGKNITYISDYLLVDAVNVKELIISTRAAALSDKTICFSEGTEPNIKYYVYSDSAAKDYLKEHNISYASLGCEHSRSIEYSEEMPSCCYDTYGVYTCTDCGYSYKEYLSAESKGHYFSGSVNSLNNYYICGAELYIDGKLSAITNDKGQFVVHPVFCGNHSIEIKKHGAVIDSFDVAVNRNNLKCNLVCSYGDFDSNGYVNAKDYSFALKNDFDDISILDFGKAQHSVSLDTFDKQEFPYALKVENRQSEDNDAYRDFIAVIENYSEYTIKESGFIYGKNMSEEMLFLEKVGQTNEEGFSVKVKASTNNESYEKLMKYGSTSKTGTLSARFYIIYTNGVEDFTYYSDVSSYTFEN